jgi:hypothetical protein
MRTMFRVIVFALALAAMAFCCNDLQAGRWKGGYRGDDSYLYSPSYKYGLQYTNSNFDAFGRSIYDSSGRAVPQTYSAYFSHQYRQSYQWYPEQHY